MKSFNTKYPLFRYSLSATLELSSMFRCKVQIFHHDLAHHHHHHSYQYNHTTSSNIAIPQPTSLSYLIIPPPSPTKPAIFLCLPTSPSFRHTRIIPLSDRHSFIPSSSSLINPRCDSIPLLGLRFSNDISQWFGFSRIPLMKLPHCL